MGKRITYLLVAIALIVTSMVSFNMKGAGTIAHAGNGTGMDVGNMETLVDVAEFIGGGNVTSSSMYRSATVHINTSSKSDYSSSNPDVTGGVKNKKSATESEVTYYLTPNGVYIEAQGVSFSTSVVNVEETGKATEQKRVTSLTRYNVNIYFSPNKCYIKINDYNEVSKYSSTVVNAEYMNKWVEVPYGNISDLFNIESSVKSSLYDIIDTIEELIDAGKLSETDKSASFNESEFAEIYGSSIDPDDYTIEFDVDLNDKKHSYISFVTASDISDTYSWTNQNGYENSSNVHSQSKSVIDIVISNVNNTTIDWDIKVDTKVTSDQFKNFFTYKTYKED